jgi:TolB protein
MLKGIGVYLAVVVALLVATAGAGATSTVDRSAIASITQLSDLVARTPAGKTLSIASGAANPAWSPSGRFLAYTDTNSYGLELATLRGPMREITRVPSHYYVDNYPTWSPDGRRVAFARTIPTLFQNGVPTATETEIFVVALSGAHISRLTRDHAEDTDPAWSPSGRAIAFVCDGNIMQLDVRTHRESLLIRNGDQPAWSPDGRRLAFVRTEPDTGLRWILIASANGHQVRRLTPVGTDARQPAWSPDARKLVFTVEVAGPELQMLYMIGIDGKGLRNLPGTKGYSEPTWQPAAPKRSTGRSG